MNKHDNSNDKLGKLELARDLFSELLVDGDGYPHEVSQELKKDLSECESKIEEMKSLEREAAACKEYAKVWTRKSSSEGQIIYKQKFDELVKKKSNYDIFIIDNGEYYRKTVGKVYLRGKPIFPRPKKKGGGGDETKYLTPLLYRLLFYTLKLNGSPGEVFDLIEFCWFKKNLANNLKKTHKKSDGKIVRQDELHKHTGMVRTAASRLSAIFFDELGIELTTSKTGFYCLNTIPNYCLIELL